MELLVSSSRSILVRALRNRMPEKDSQSPSMHIAAHLLAGCPVIVVAEMKPSLTFDPGCAMRFRPPTQQLRGEGPCQGCMGQAARAACS
eukprot:768664-Hanusia_phi.AAC.2